MQQVKDTSVVLVLGGVRSGKSRYAQRLAESASRVTFIATAESRDDEEMQRKIERHRSDRPSHWTTIEEPLELGRAVQSAGPECETILVDCLTLFAASLLEACQDDAPGLEAQIDGLCEALRAAACRVILVSNEVGSGVVPAHASGRRFRDLAGEINQRVASVADTVLLLVAGLPLTLKGSAIGGLQ